MCESLQNSRCRHFFVFKDNKSFVVCCVNCINSDTAIYIYDALSAASIMSHLSREQEDKVGWIQVGVFAKEAIWHVFFFLCVRNKGRDIKRACELRKSEKMFVSG